ncbi:MAG: GNAT family N-acetyltransferase [Candidatus Levyibacteriota bacterium]
MDPVVKRAAPEERLPLQRMLELYQHDLSDIWDQDLDPHGEYGYDLDRYWQDPRCHPYVFLVGDRYAGFALVDPRVRIPGDDFWIDQFFVMKKYRRAGIGNAAATRIFALHPGRWQVGQMPGNQAAQAFWRRTIGEFSAGRYEETRITSGWWQGVVQRFASMPGSDAATAIRTDSSPGRG